VGRLRNVKTNHSDANLSQCQFVHQTCLSATMSTRPVPVPLFPPHLSQYHFVHQTCPGATFSTRPVPVPLCPPNLSQCHFVHQTCSSATLQQILHKLDVDRTRVFAVKVPATTFLCHSTGPKHVAPLFHLLWAECTCNCLDQLMLNLAAIDICGYSG
jgi:hypothetical protein